MPSPDFDPLVKQLLDLGIAQKYALRLSAELDDHFTDLRNEALRDEKSPLAAAVEAQMRLGDADSIVAAFAGHRELKSWIYRSRLLWHCLYAVSWLALFAVRGTLSVLAGKAIAARLAVASAAAVVITGLMLFTLDVAVSLGEFVKPGVHSRYPGRAVVMTAPFHVATRSRVLVAGPAERTRPARPEPPTERPERASITFTYDAEVELRAEIGRDNRYLAQTTLRVSQPFQVGDGDYLPIVKVAPSFPALAAARGLEGYVVIEYTVTSIGSVKDVVVVDSSSNVFEASAVKAAYRFKYKPRVIDGRAVPVRGVRTLVSFKLRA